MNDKKVLVVEDENDIRELIHFHLYRNKFNVIEKDSGIGVLELVKKEKPNIVLLDIMLPGLSGLEVCRQLKEDNETADTKIIFLSAKGEESDIVNGLELGADDYISKPFSPKVLIARVNAVLRREANQDKNFFEYSDISIDDAKKRVKVEGEEKNLTAAEYQLLCFLIKNPGNVYTRSQIVNSIKGDNHAVTDRSVDTQVVSLRKKLGDKGVLIETVWGVGYRFKDLNA